MDHCLPGEKAAAEPERGFFRWRQPLREMAIAVTVVRLKAEGTPSSLLPTKILYHARRFGAIDHSEERSHRRHSSWSDKAGPAPNSTTSVRPDEKFVPWKSSRSKSQEARASTVKPPPSVRSSPTAARWSNT